MNITSLDRFIQQTVSRTRDGIGNQRSQTEIAASIGSSNSLQTEKARLAQQIQETLQRRSPDPTTTNPAPKQNKDSNYTFSIYV